MAAKDARAIGGRGLTAANPAKRVAYQAEDPFLAKDARNGAPQILLFAGFQSLVEDQNGGGDYCGPEAAFVAYGGLGDVGGADYFVGEAVDLFFFVPGTVGGELYV